MLSETMMKQLSRQKNSCTGKIIEIRVLAGRSTENQRFV